MVKVGYLLLPPARHRASDARAPVTHVQLWRMNVSTKWTIEFYVWVVEEMNVFFIDIQMNEQMYIVEQMNVSNKRALLFIALSDAGLQK